MGQHQRQQLDFVNDLSAESFLQIRGSEQELITAQKLVNISCTILLILSASTLNPLVLAAHLDEMDSRKAGGK
jgi:hypothetical protein